MAPNLNWRRHHSEVCTKDNVLSKNWLGLFMGNGLEKRDFLEREPSKKIGSTYFVDICLPSFIGLQSLPITEHNGQRVIRSRILIGVIVRANVMTIGDGTTS